MLNFAKVAGLAGDAIVFPMNFQSRRGAAKRFDAFLVTILVLLCLPVPAVPQDQPDVKALIANRQLDSAEKIIVSQMMAKPQDPDLITLLAEVRLDQGRPKESLTLLNDAERVGGVTALRAQLIALAESAAGRLDLAEPQFHTAIQLDPNYAPAHYFLARLLYTRNRFDEAIQQSKTAVALSPEMVRAYENLGLCYEGKHDLKEAERWYLEAIHRDAASQTKTEWPLIDLATMLIHNDRAPDAKPYLTQALAINPHNAQSLFEMGVLLEKSGIPKPLCKTFVMP